MSVKTSVVFSVAMCIILCHASGVLSEEDSCFQNPDPGICRASIPRFFFDSRSGSCEIFTYGGCGGNRNNFVTGDECQSFRNYCLRRRRF